MLATPEVKVTLAEAYQGCVKHVHVNRYTADTKGAINCEKHVQVDFNVPPMAKDDAVVVIKNAGGILMSADGTKRLSLLDNSDLHVRVKYLGNGDL